MKQKTTVTGIVDKGQILPRSDTHFLAKTAQDEMHDSTGPIKDPDGEVDTESNRSFESPRNIEDSELGSNVILSCKVPMSRLQDGK